MGVAPLRARPGRGPETKSVGSHGQVVDDCYPELNQSVGAMEHSQDFHYQLSSYSSCIELSHVELHSI